MHSVGVPFRKAMKRQDFVFTRYSVAHKHACKIWVCFDTPGIYYDFLRENTQKTSLDVRRLPFVLRFRRNLTCEIVGVTHTRMQKLGAFRPC